MSDISDTVDFQLNSNQTDSVRGWKTDRDVQHLFIGHLAKKVGVLVKPKGLQPHWNF